MNIPVRSAGAFAHFTVRRKLPVIHTCRFVANNTRFAETLPTWVSYEKGSHLTLNALPIPGGELSMFVDKNGWAFSATAIARMLRDGDLSQSR